MPFQSNLVPMFQTFHMTMSLICIKIEPVGETHFHLNGFARKLVLKQRQKWPILRIYAEHCDNSSARFGTVISFLSFSLFFVVVVVVAVVVVFCLFICFLLITLAKFRHLSCISFTIILPSICQNSKLLSQFSFTNQKTFLVIYFSR